MVKPLLIFRKSQLFGNCCVGAIITKQAGFDPNRKQKPLRVVQDLWDCAEFGSEYLEDALLEGDKRTKLPNTIGMNFFS
jgi:hypothetical protein